MSAADKTLYAIKNLKRGRFISCMYNAGRRGCMSLRPALFFLMSVPSRNMAVLRATSKNSCYLDSRICMYYTVLVTVIRLDWKRR